MHRRERFNGFPAVKKRLVSRWFASEILGRRKQRRESTCVRSAIECLEERILLTEVPFTKTIIADDFDRAWHVAAADMDGDGDLDVLGSSGHRWGDEDDSIVGEVIWWENTQGDASVFAEHTVTESPINGGKVIATDLDGDGDLDILGTMSQGVVWWENSSGDGSRFEAQTIDEGSGDVSVADVDGDGDVDLIVAPFRVDSEIHWLENVVGDGSVFQRHVVDADVNHPLRVSSADVDGDGDLDILGLTLCTAEIAWWENLTGDGTAFTQHTISDQFAFANVVSGMDVDGDGDIDVLSGANLDNALTWWENANGEGRVFIEHSFDTARYGPDHVVAADVDGDGDTDFLGAEPRGDRLTWWENTTGDGTILNEHVIAEFFDGATDIVAADMDGDGDLDVLGAASRDDEIALWINQPTHKDEPTDLPQLPSTPQPSDPPRRTSITGPATHLGDVTPTITWAESAESEEYQLLVYSQTEGKALIDVILPGTEATTSNLPDDIYEVYVRGINATGAAPWSDPSVFTLSREAPAETPVIYGPISQIDDTTPTIAWNNVPTVEINDGGCGAGSIYYDVVVYHVERGVEVDSGFVYMDTHFETTELAPGGTYEAYVRRTGDIRWSPMHRFTIVHAEPPRFNTPTSSTMTFDWTASDKAVSYELLVYNIDTGREVARVPGIHRNSVTLPQYFAGMRLQAFVRATSATGSSRWSDPLEIVFPDIGANSVGDPATLAVLTDQIEGIDEDKRDNQQHLNDGTSEAESLFDSEQTDQLDAILEVWAETEWWTDADPFNQ